MKILFVHNFHQKFGGDDAVVQNYVNMLRRRGHTVDLYQRHNDEILGFGFVAKVRFFVDAIFSIRTWRELDGLIRASRPDFLFVHGVYPLISPSVYDLAWRRGVPVVQMVHDMRFWCPSAWFYRSGGVCTLCAKGNFLHSIKYRCYRGSYVLSALYAASIFLLRVRGFFKKVGLFVIPSEHIRGYLLDAGVPLERIALHPHIVPASGLAAPCSNGDARYIAFLGRLSPEKGLWTLIKAAQQLPEIQFKIGGVGPMKDELDKYVDQYGLRNVEFVGFVKGAAKERFLRNAAILLAPSECYESFGQVVVEAYAAGTPVVAANHGGLASLIDDQETGWFFRPTDVAELVQVLRKAWNCKSMDRMSQAVLRKYRETLSEERLVAHLEQRLQGLVKN